MMSFDGAAEPPGFSFRGGTALQLSLVAMVFFQAALGAYVRHLQAGQACPDFPKCLGQWVPSSMSPTVMAHYSHRLLGLMVLLTALVIYFLFRKDPDRWGSRKLPELFLALVAGQIGLGGLVVLSGLQYGVVALHLSVALAILLVLGRLWVEAVRANRGAPSLLRH
jgi:heme A synthase